MESVASSSRNLKNQSSASIELAERNEQQKNLPLTVTTSDDEKLLSLGKKPVLKRSFGFMSVLGFSCTILITWEGAIIVCSSTLVNGGPAGVIWGFLLGWIGTMSTFATIAELASMAPTAGGQYHWVAMLAPTSSRRFLSYLTAWTTITGWIATNLSTAYLNASMIQGMAALANLGYAPTAWQTMLITWASVLFAVAINLTSSRALARFESVILFIHILGFFGIMIPLVYFGPHHDASYVFTTRNNGGGWSSNGLSLLVGIPSMVFCLLGADGSVHMAEEIQNASMAVPQALIYTIGINGCLGMAILIAFAFCLGNLQAAIAAEETVGFPFIEVFAQAVQSVGGAVAMTSVLAAMGIFCTVGTTASATRLLWAFARDRGVPFPKFLSKVHTRSALPFNTVLVTTIVSFALSLLALGSAVVIDDVLSLTVASLYSSYFICCALLLYRRLQPRDKNNGLGPFGMSWGPWRLPEPFGTINNALACAYLLWMLFWSFWPPYAEVEASTMNFSVVIYSAVVIFSIAWYFIWAKKDYHGPVSDFGSRN